VIAADGTYQMVRRSWSGTPAAMTALLDSLRRELAESYGRPCTCGEAERLWTLPGWWVRVRAYSARRRDDEPRTATHWVELSAYRVTKNTPPECMAELMARLEKPESWPMPSAGARLIPLDARIPALEDRVAGGRAPR
jgi:hypothetical protein